MSEVEERQDVEYEVVLLVKRKHAMMTLTIAVPSTFALDERRLQ